MKYWISMKTHTPLFYSSIQSFYPSFFLSVFITCAPICKQFSMRVARRGFAARFSSIFHAACRVFMRVLTTNFFIYCLEFSNCFLHLKLAMQHVVEKFKPRRSNWKRELNFCNTNKRVCLTDLNLIKICIFSLRRTEKTYTLYVNVVLVVLFTFRCQISYLNLNA